MTCVRLASWNWLEGVAGGGGEGVVAEGRGEEMEGGKKPFCKCQVSRLITGNGTATLSGKFSRKFAIQAPGNPCVSSPHPFYPPLPPLPPLSTTFPLLLLLPHPLSIPLLHSQPLLHPPIQKNPFQQPSCSSIPPAPHPPSPPPPHLHLRM